jgi:uncharacterized protein YabE (DUF348 family)
LSDRILAELHSQTVPLPLRSEDREGWLARLFALTLSVITVAVMIVGYMRSGQMVAVKVNGRLWHTRTHQRTVGALLREGGVELQPEDIVLPAVEASLEQSQTIVVQKALSVLIEADGHVVEHHTHSHRVGDVLREAGLRCKPHDVVMLDNRVVDLEASLPHHEWAPSRWPLFRRLADKPVPSWTWLKLKRAVSLSINDGGMHTMIYTVARTVGEALLGQDIVLYLGDRIHPSLGTLLTAGMYVEVLRAKPVTLQVDGRLIKTRTLASNVAQVLSDTGIRLLGKDYTLPELNAEVTQEMTIRVVRVIEAWVWETEDIPFDTVSHLDDSLELDQYRTDQGGRLGVGKRRVRILYEDGEETERVITDEWVERQPTTRVTSHGARVVVRELETPDGVIRYWRKIRMLATSYTAATAGKKPDHPLYGITRLGWQAKKGVVAVDPRVINLGSQVYVPGYGLGTAADTGGMIKGRWIDLCYDEDNLVLWKRWVDVYLLEPIPPADEIDWILPNYPAE